MNRLERIKYLNEVHVSLGRCPGTVEVRRIVKEMILREEQKIVLLNKVKFAGQFFVLAFSVTLLFIAVAMS